MHLTELSGEAVWKLVLRSGWQSAWSSVGDSIADTASSRVWGSVWCSVQDRVAVAGGRVALAVEEFTHEFD